MKLQRQIDQLLARRASEWHQTLEHADESQRAEFVAWLKQSPLHIQEYLEATYTDRVLEHIDPDRREDVEKLLAQIVPTVTSLTTASGRADAAHSDRPGMSPRRRWWVGLGVAASFLLCAVVAPLVYVRMTAGPEYSTTIGEQRTVELADLSVVTMNTDSTIEVRLEDTRRDIELLRGEALFKVSHDPDRPFVVRTKTAIVRAVGTQFDVYEKPTGTSVSVLEGRVVVSSTMRRLPTTLGAGQAALVRPDGTIQEIAKADVAKTVAWRERRIVFQDAALEDMVYEFNRYSRTLRLRLAGVPAGSHHYNGIFDVADPDSLADLLMREPDLIVERRDGEIVIRAR